MEIPNRQAEIDALTRKYLSDPEPSPASNGHRPSPVSREDDEILDLCRKAGNSAKFESLYDAGDASAYDGDVSRADQALVGMLVFYTQEFEQIERLVSSSALGQRSKWTNRADYRRRTIERALSNPGETYGGPGPVTRHSQRPGEEMEEPGYSPPRPETQTAAALVNTELPPARWTVPDVLPEGVTLLAGKPKKGKSWLALGLCEAIAAGGVAFGTKRVEQGETLYLALEDNTRRLKKRLKKVLDGRPAPARMHVCTEWPRLAEGGARALEDWLTEHPEARLVVIDTLAKIRMPSAGQNVYAEDYAALEVLLPMAARHGVSIVVVHHLRKMAAADPMDEISSSTGLTAGVDGFMILRRTPGSKGPTLYVEGRDVEDPTEYALHWNTNTATWTIEGSAEEVHMSDERGSILLTIDRSPDPMTPKEVSDMLPGSKHATVKKLMWFMLADDQLIKDSKGRYSRPHHTTPPNPTNPPNHGNRGNRGNRSNSGNRGNPTEEEELGLPEPSGGNPSGNPSNADRYAEKGHSVTGVTGVTGFPYSETFGPEDAS
jgi:hypothetical protein